MSKLLYYAYIVLLYTILAAYWVKGMNDTNLIVRRDRRQQPQPIEVRLGRTFLFRKLVNGAQWLSFLFFSLPASMPRMIYGSIGRLAYCINW
jgi:hypothetical protein